MNNKQHIRDGLIRIMRKRTLSLRQASEEIPCNRITLDKFLTSDDKLTPVMVMMIEQWVNDNLKETKDNLEESKKDV